MIKGRIIKIWFDGSFNIQIENYKKSYPTSKEMDDDLIYILRNANDKNKLELLKKDLEHYFKEGV